MTGWDVFTGRASPQPGTLTELAALPGYDVIVASRGW